MNRLFTYDQDGNPHDTGMDVSGQMLPWIIDRTQEDPVGIGNPDQKFPVHTVSFENMAGTFARIGWIVENTTGEVAITFHLSAPTYRFESLAEATHFKLTFQG